MYRIYDSLHGFIRFEEVEKRLIDTFLFQRLHYLKQLGIAFMVYPGATHSRFEHSLGVMHIATGMLDLLKHELTYLQDYEEEYFRLILRLASLCHDLGHLPFSHAAEQIILGPDGHEKRTFDILQSPLMDAVFNPLQKHFPNRNVVKDITSLAIGEKKLRALGLSEYLPFNDGQRILSEMITGDFFGADRIDYLLRDARCTGVSHGLFDFHQLLESLCLVTDKEGKTNLGIAESGIQACEALLLSRHFMHKRVYQYPSVKAYTFHLALFMQQLYQNTPLYSLDDYLQQTDASVMHAIMIAYRDTHHLAHKHAQALIERKHRVMAIRINKNFNHQQFVEWKKKASIPDEAITLDYDLSDYKKDLPFIVKRKNGELALSQEVMEISIPKYPYHFVYVDSPYFDSVSSFIEKL